MANKTSSLRVDSRDGGHSTVNGTAWIVQPYIHVNWLWMIYPCAVWFLTVVFVLLAILATRADVPLWKSSQIALVYCLGGNLHSTQDFDEFARGKDAQLEKAAGNAGGTWCLRELL
jgi:hypothetical protein